MSAAAGHHVTLRDRGPVHRHRWIAVCSCGWAAIPLRLKRAARLAGNHHLGGVVGRRARHRYPIGPAPVTPEHRLPAALRTPGGGHMPAA